MSQQESDMKRAQIPFWLSVQNQVGGSGEALSVNFFPRSFLFLDFLRDNMDKGFVPIGIDYEKWWLAKYGGTFTEAFAVRSDPVAAAVVTETVPEKDLPKPWSHSELSSE